MAAMKQTPPNGRMRSRIAVLILLMCGVCFFAVAVKLFFMQVIHNDFYTQKAQQYQTKDSIVTPSRGTIYDRNMNKLAESAATERVTINPQNVYSKEREEKTGLNATQQRENVAQMLSEKLSLSYETVLAQVNDTSMQYKDIKSRVDQDTCNSIREWMNENGSYGISFTPDTRRYYINGAFASQVLGMTNTDGTGIYGVEAAYDEELTGKPGRLVRAENARNGEMPFEYEQYVEAEDGCSLVLTIDETIQSILEKHLETALEDNPYARDGVEGIVMNPKTGEIYAMASMPDYDPNEPYTLVSIYLTEEKRQIAELMETYQPEAEYEITDEYYIYGRAAGLVNVPNQDMELPDRTVDIYEDGKKVGERPQTLIEAIKECRSAALVRMWTNQTVSSTQEPGSTFKLMTVSTAMETGAVTANTPFYCSGSRTVTGVTIGCWKEGGHGTEDTMHALMNSCNPAMIEMGFKTGANKFYEYMQAYGLMSKTGIDLPGESSGIFFAGGLDGFKSSDTNLPVATFGQRFQVTSIQMISMISAVVDDGKLKTPYIVKEVLNPDGSVKETAQTEVKRQVISAQTSAFMREAMEQAVYSGTAQNAYVAGYRVGGKTATAEIQKESYDVEDRYNAGITAVAPIDDPQVVVYIVVKDLPYGVNHGGGRVAAPIAARVLADVLPYLGVEPVYNEEEAGRAEHTIPNLVGMTEAEASAALAELGMTYRTKGSDSDVVTDQIPAAGVKLQANSKLILYMGGEQSGDMVEVPNLTGLTPQGCRERLEYRGLYLKRMGVPNKNTSTATRTLRQYPEAGTMVPQGTVVTVEFINSTNIGD